MKIKVLSVEVTSQRKIGLNKIKIQHNEHRFDFDSSQNRVVKQGNQEKVAQNQDFFEVNQKEQKGDLVPNSPFPFLRKEHQ